MLGFVGPLSTFLSSSPQIGAATAASRFCSGSSSSTTLRKQEEDESSLGDSFKSKGTQTQKKHEANRGCIKSGSTWPTAGGPAPLVSCSVLARVVDSPCLQMGGNERERGGESTYKSGVGNRQGIKAESKDTCSPHPPPFSLLLASFFLLSLQPNERTCSSEEDLAKGLLLAAELALPFFAFLLLLHLKRVARIALQGQKHLRHLFDKSGEEQR